MDKENGKTPSTDKSAYRKCWEVYHAVSGFITMAVGFGQVRGNESDSTMELKRIAIVPCQL